MIRGQRVWFWVGWLKGEVKLMEKGERVTTGVKGRGEIRSEAGEVNGVVTDGPAMDSLGMVDSIYASK